MGYQKQIIEELAQEPEFVKDTITSLSALKDLAKMGKPKTAAELQERLDEYFIFCKDNSMKPGIESMSLALNIDRRTFWTWCNGSKGTEYQEICTRARQVLTSFIETSMYSGKINPAAAIFSLKNTACWTDAVQIETNTRADKTPTAALLPIWDENSANFNNLPIAQELNNLRSDIPTFENEE